MVSNPKDGMVNRLLHALIYDDLVQLGFEVFENVNLPPNDACISFGQAIVAQSRVDKNCYPKSQI